MNSRRWLTIGALAVGIGLGLPARAQEGTPASGAPPTASCDAVAPRDAEYFARLARSPAATPADDATARPQQGGEATPVTAELPDGQVADAATVAEITALYETLVDCLNRGDYLRAYALYTEAYLLRNLRAETISQLAATPVPTAASTRTAFGGVLEARVLDDGRVAALVTTSNPNTGEVLTKATMAREDDGLRIDDAVVVEAATPGTPDG